jgi:hypothetical protein
MLEAAQTHVAPIAAVVVAMSVGGIGVAYGDSHPSGHPAIKAKGKRKNHVLSVDYKTAPVRVIDESQNTVDVQPKQPQDGLQR